MMVGLGGYGHIRKSFIRVEGGDRVGKRLIITYLIENG
jgi:hypothetical protein